MVDLTTLTPRETEVLGHLLDGRSSKDIARAMAIEVSTVNEYRSRILRKTKFSRTPELVAAVRESLPKDKRPALRESTSRAKQSA